MPSDRVVPVCTPSTMPVATNNGQIASTRMSWRAHSRSSASVRLLTADLVAP
ncbi:Uncharacterised protein [Mycobacteroides abscessus subsp. abscessus]|nr:Uncharacterised protein [Mycobacteroides abscessus subsp. abscessus]